MFKAIWQFFINEERFYEALHALIPNTAVLMRVLVALAGALVYMGVVPGGGTTTGSWISFFAMTVVPFLIKAGDKNLSPEQLTAMIEEELKRRIGQAPGAQP